MNTPVISVRIPSELKEALDKQASKEGRTLSNMIIYILSCYLKSL